MDEINYFEFFAGIGSQAIAANIVNDNRFNNVGICEWDAYAIINYFNIHGYKFGEIDLPDDEYIKDYLRNRQYSLDGKSVSRSIVSKPIKFLRELYEADITLNNNPNIESIDNNFFNENNIDLLTYSFPCQDLSCAGNQLGIERGSNSRSGLLWRVEELLLHSDVENRPTFLLMENVKNLLNNRHFHHFNEYLNSLHEMGYINVYGVLNAREYGIPQNRERVFCLSIKQNFLIENNIEIIDCYNPIQDSLDDLLVDYKTEMPSLLNFLKIDYTNETYLNEACWATLRSTKSRIKMWNSEKRLLNYVNGEYTTDELKKPLYTKTITTKQDRWGNSGMLAFEKNKYGRPLTPRETFLLMGFSEEHYERIPTKFNKIDGKNTEFQIRKLYHQTGNSIVVDCLVAIFSLIDNF